MYESVRHSAVSAPGNYYLKTPFTSPASRDCYLANNGSFIDSHTLPSLATPTEFHFVLPSEIFSVFVQKSLVATQQDDRSKQLAKRACVVPFRRKHIVTVCTTDGHSRELVRLVVTRTRPLSVLGVVNRCSCFSRSVVKMD